MKKILSKILIISPLRSNSRASADTGNDSFDLDALQNTIPAEDLENSSDNGQSNGAVTAIVAGSIVGGLALLGALAWLYFNRGFKKGSTASARLFSWCNSFGANMPKRFRMQGEKIPIKLKIK